jgi:hypothetical protein
MTTTIFTNHHPILGFAPMAGSNPAPGNLALQSVMSSLNAQAYYPPGIHVALHGHVHDFQAINFASAHPATIVSGNGGDNLDVALPDPLPGRQRAAPGTTIDGSRTRKLWLPGDGPRPRPPRAGPSRPTRRPAS